MKTGVLAVDIGFEFVDLAFDRNGRVTTAKHPVGQAAPDQAILRAIEAISADADFELSQLTAIRVASTGGLNALFSRRGGRVALITNTGFADTLFLGRQNRRDLYDPVARLATPAFLVLTDDIHEVGGRLDATGDEIAPLDTQGLSEIIDRLEADPVDAVAICLLHAHLEPTHEKACADAITARLPELPVVVSHVADPNPREFERTVSTCLEAWLLPSQATVMRNLAAAFEQRGFAGNLQFCDGTGQLLSLKAACADVSAHLTSGPASAARHAADLAREAGVVTAITLDIGSTTTDMALIRDGMPTTTRHSQVADVPLRRIMSDVHSCTMGGLAQAKPDGLGGILMQLPDGDTYPILTECLARLGTLSLAADEKTATRLDALARETGSESREEAARAVVAAAEQTVAQAVLRYAVQRNVDPARVTLVAMGGLGSTLVPGIADRLGCTDILLPVASAVAGAMGMLSMTSSDTARIRVDAALKDLGQTGLDRYFRRLRALLPAASDTTVEWLSLEIAPTASMHPFDVELDTPTNAPDRIIAAFVEQYAARYGITPPFSGHLFAMTLSRGAATPDRRWPLPSMDESVTIAEGWTRAAVPGGFRMTRSRS
ncbi:hydantoinase/oxoprolinase N-terminal domain-containing protein [Amorphus sp. 3PC139-8]|uniref:hydantoinase/oxoprolinase N-terminal domain-containing protein n=1 Tax=Amorphus sp. 3PC139-8 TaxID=2735676 RepID=UPI00345DE3AB